MGQTSGRLILINTGGTTLRYSLVTTMEVSDPSVHLSPDPPMPGSVAAHVGQTIEMSMGMNGELVQVFNPARPGTLWGTCEIPGS